MAAGPADVLIIGAGAAGAAGGAAAKRLAEAGGLSGAAIT